MLKGVPPIAANALIAELAPGEEVLWCATPSLGKKSGDPIIVSLLVAFGIVILGGLIWVHHLATALGEFGAHFERTIDLLLFGGSSLVLAVFYFILWRIYRRTIYAITDRRVIIIHALFRRRIQSFTGEQLIRAVRVEDKRGNGDVFFERNIGFYGVKDVRTIGKLLRQIYDSGA